MTVASDAPKSPAPASSAPIRWTFLLPGLARPAGGLIAAYELANAMAANGTDRVCIAHFPTSEARVRSASEIWWFTFHRSVTHEFLTSLDPSGLPHADVVVYTVMAIDLCLAPDAGEPGKRLMEQLQAEESAAGLPILFVQGLAVFPERTEMRALAGMGPKVCVGAWMADNLVRAGLPSTEVVHVPNGVNKDIFRVTTPIADRTPRIAMNYNPHPLKNMGGGLAVLERVDRELGVPSILFGPHVPTIPPNSRIRYAPSPSTREVPEVILAGSSIYLQPSVQEGFGMAALEAMACGCALVTTDNGGAGDYALDGETAVVCAAETDAMFEAVKRLLHDDGARVRIASNGASFAQEMTWARSASDLRAVAAAYRADPPSFRRGRGGPIDRRVTRL